MTDPEDTGNEGLKGTGVARHDDALSDEVEGTMDTKGFDG